MNGQDSPEQDACLSDTAQQEAFADAVSRVSRGMCGHLHVYPQLITRQLVAAENTRSLEHVTHVWTYCADAYTHALTPVTNFCVHAYPHCAEIQRHRAPLVPEQHEYMTPSSSPRADSRKNYEACSSGGLEAASTPVTPLKGKERNGSNEINSKHGRHRRSNSMPAFSTANIINNSMPALVSSGFAASSNMPSLPSRIPPTGSPSSAERGEAKTCAKGAVDRGGSDRVVRGAPRHASGRVGSHGSAASVDSHETSVNAEREVNKERESVHACMHAWRAWMCGCMPLGLYLHMPCMHVSYVSICAYMHIRTPCIHTRARMHMHSGVFGGGDGRCGQDGFRCEHTGKRRCPAVWSVPILG